MPVSYAEASRLDPMMPLLFKYRQSCLLALCALMGLAWGDLAATLLTLRLNRDGAIVPSQVRVGASQRVATKDDAAELAVILQHNLFDLAARGQAAQPFVLQANAGLPAASPVPGDLELVGVVVAGARSLVVIRSGKETKTYRLGSAGPAGGKIEEIARHQVKIRNADQSLTLLTMHQGDSTIPAGREPQGSVAAPGGGVRTAGNNRWVISRTTAESVRGNLGEQMRTALIQPLINNGRTEGFVVARINPGTLLAEMGLRRGDLIKRVNTMALDSPERALQVLQQLREAREISVDLERDGRPLSFAYVLE